MEHITVVDLAVKLVETLAYNLAGYWASTKAALLELARVLTLVDEKAQQTADTLAYSLAVKMAVKMD